MAKVPLERLTEKLGVRFARIELLNEALTHRSYLNENPSWPLPNNERLEFLGDAAIELAVTEFLYKKFPDKQEGELTSLRASLVNYQMLGSIAKDIGVEAHLLLSRGEAKDTGKAREVILANAMESVIGAVYLDQGYESVRDVVGRIIMPRLDAIIEKGLYRDPKSALQEVIQERLRLTPTYRVMSENGPDHQKLFRVGVYFGEVCGAEGTGTSKQEAEAKAAETALEKFKNSN